MGLRLLSVSAGSCGVDAVGGYHWNHRAPDPCCCLWVVSMLPGSDWAVPRGLPGALISDSCYVPMP